MARNLQKLMAPAHERRERIRESVMQGIEEVFPLEGKYFRIELDSFIVNRRIYSNREQKQAILERSTLTEPIKGRLRLVEVASGRVVDRSTRVLAHVPYMTERTTFMLKGNEYQVSSQLRNKPGVYTRERGNGELEAAFNLAVGKNFRLSMEPESGRLNIEYGTSKYPLYSLLRALGVERSEIQAAWGRELEEANASYGESRIDSTISKLYSRVIPSYSRQDGASKEEQLQAIRDMFSRTQMDGRVTRATLGEAHDTVTTRAMLAASRKLIRVYNAQEQPDDRDSLAFKTLQTTESFFKERIAKDSARALRSKVIPNLNKPMNEPTLDKMMPSGAPFSKGLQNFMVTSALSNTPMMINPMEIIDAATKVTSLGEGGVSSTRAVPDEARDVHGSHLGMLDPVRTPESGKAGIDIRGALGLARDDQGNLYTAMINAKTGKAEYVDAATLSESNVAFHSQEDRFKKKKTVEGLRAGTIAALNPDDVNYIVPSAGALFSPSTNLVPMTESAMGNRNIMGAKFQTQALPLTEREAPLIQVQSWSPSKSVEQQFGQMISPTAPVAGTIEKIDDDYIYIRPSSQKKASAADSEYIPLAAHLAKDEVEGSARVSRRNEDGKTRVTLFDLDEIAASYLVHHATNGIVITQLRIFDVLEDGELANRLHDSMVESLDSEDGQILLKLSPAADAAHRRFVEEALDAEPLPNTPNVYVIGDAVSVVEDESGTVYDAYAGVEHIGRMQIRDAESFDELLRMSIPDGVRGQKVAAAFFDVHAGSRQRDLRVTPLDEYRSLYASLGFTACTNMEMEKTAAPRTRVEAKGKVRRDDESDGLVRVPYAQNFPYSSKTYIHDEIKAKKGQRVRAGQSLGDNNYTQNGTLALGKNLTVAYMPYHGLNSNDAVVISEGAARKMRSQHMYKESLTIDRSVVLSRDKHKVYYGPKYSRPEYDRLDEQGVIKKGETVNHGELLIAAMRRAAPTAQTQMLGKLHKSLVKPFRDIAVTWEHAHPGEVVDVAITRGAVVLTVKTEEPIQIGDKLCVPTDTEVLTRGGWVQIDDVTLQHSVAILDPVRMVFSYEEPSAYHRYPCDGEELLHFKSGRVDQLTTRDHRVYARRSGEDHYAVWRAEELLSCDTEFRATGSWWGGTGEPLDLGDQRIYRDHLLTLCLACILGDVSFPREGMMKLVAQDAAIVAATSRALASCIGVNFRLDSGDAGPEFTIRGDGLLACLRGPSDTADPQLPAALLSAPRSHISGVSWWIKEFFAGVELTRSLADQLQHLALHAQVYYEVQQCASGMCVLIPRTAEPLSVLANEVERVCYVGDVCCLTVSTGVFLTRRNGKVAWTGNCNRFGAKGVVSKIVADDQMIQNEAGEPVDVLLTSAGIITRVNPSQVIETAVAKVAKKTGQPIAVPQGSARDNAVWARELLQQHGVKDKETMFDPISGRSIPGILTGPQYTMKLFKSTETNFSARGIGGGYDANMQPTKGGDEGAKGMGKMEMNALLAHNARAILRENATIKSQRNDEYWRRVQLGLPAPVPAENFAFNKFQAMLTGSGVQMRKEGKKLALAPLTDRDIDAMASHTITSANMVRTQTGKGTAMIEPESGGLFDPVATGGMSGTKYSKIELSEPVLNPVFREPARILLGMSQSELAETLKRDGAGALRTRLNALDLDAMERAAVEEIKTTRGSERNKRIKRVKYIRALKKEQLQAGDAYVLSKIPVTPPMMRPISPNPDGTTLVSDANYLYRDLMLANQSIQDTPEELRSPEFLSQQREHLQATVGALFGTEEPTSPQNQGRGVKGHLMQITGTGSPKHGYFQSKLVKRRMDLTGRGTAAPDPSLGLDEVGLPEEQIWSMFQPFIIRRLVRNGHRASDALRAYQDRTPAARRAMEEEIKVRPVLMNRAPTLHRWNTISAYAKPRKGKTINTNPFIESGMNLDFDGDALQLSVPVRDEAVEEAKKMTISNLIFADRSKDSLMAFPAHEAIIGTYMATTAKEESGEVRRFATVAEAKAAYNRNEISAGTEVVIDELEKKK